MGPRIERKRQWVSQYESNDILIRRQRVTGRTVRPKHIILCIIPGIILLSFVSDVKNLNEYAETLRRRMLLCKKTPYVSPDQAVNEMPEILMTDGNEMKGVRGVGDTDISSMMEKPKPTYLTMCEELVKRNQNTMEKEDKGNFLPPLTGTEWLVMREQEAVCRDWANPHHRLMDMIASQLVAYAGASFGIKYDHDCHQFIRSQHEFAFDVTTIQEIYPQLPLRLNENLVNIGDIIWTLCDNCIKEQGFSNPNSAHHCLLYPEPSSLASNSLTTMGRVQQHQQHTEGVIDGDNEGEIQWDDRRKLAPPMPSALEAALPLVKNRLYHAAIDYSKKSAIPDHDPRSGAVIYIDETSMNIPFRVFAGQMPKHATHISILTSPKCVEATLKPNNIHCIDYANRLKLYMEKHFNYGDAEVSFDIVGSTATTFSRLILTHNLLCAPGTITCLLPSLVRQASKETIILESVDETQTFHWFSSFSNHAENIKVIPLSQDDLYAEDADQINISKNTPEFVIPQHNEPIKNSAPPQSNVEGDAPPSKSDENIPTLDTQRSRDVPFLTIESEESSIPFEISKQDDTEKVDDGTEGDLVDLSVDSVKKPSDTKGGSADDVLFNIMKGAEAENTSTPPKGSPQLVQGAEGSTETPIRDWEGSNDGELDFSNFGGGEANDFAVAYNDKSGATVEQQNQKEATTTTSNTTVPVPGLEELEDLFEESSTSNGGRFGNRQK